MIDKLSEIPLVSRLLVTVCILPTASVFVHCCQLSSEGSEQLIVPLYSNGKFIDVISIHKATKLLCMEKQQCSAGSSADLGWSFRTFATKQGERGISSLETE